MAKKINKEEKAKIYLEELEEVLGSEDLSMIKTIFGVIKRSVGEDYYFDVINACCKEVLESKKIGREFSTDETVREIYSETGIKEQEVPMHTLSMDERLYSNDKALCAEIIRNRILSDVLHGKDKEILADRYSTTVEVIDHIYEEQLARYTVENSSNEKNTKNTK